MAAIACVFRATTHRIAALNVLSSLLAALPFTLGAALAASGEDAFDDAWKVFPEGSAMGLFLAVAVPLSLDDGGGGGAYVAYNVEANYALPPNSNDTPSAYPPVIARQSFAVDRRLVYDAIESTLNRHGVPGRQCVLRAICEGAAVRHVNGLLGDLLHIVITPSTSSNAGLAAAYAAAERTGRGPSTDCERYARKCRFRLLDAILR